jgi:hypothetical protein
MEEEKASARENTIISETMSYASRNGTHPGRKRRDSEHQARDTSDTYQRTKTTAVPTGHATSHHREKKCRCP